MHRLKVLTDSMPEMQSRISPVLWMRKRRDGKQKTVSVCMTRRYMDAGAPRPEMLLPERDHGTDAEQMLLTAIG